MTTLYRLDASARLIGATFGADEREDPWAGGAVAPGGFAPVITAGREFIAAGQFSVADITAAVSLDFARVVRIKPGEQHANLRRWRDALALRPAFTL